VCVLPKGARRTIICPREVKVQTKPLLSSAMWRAAAGVASLLLLIAILYTVALLIHTLNTGIAV